MNFKDIYDYWVKQVETQPKKTCNACNFLCLDMELICPRCGAYTFSKISKEDEKNIKLCDITLDSDFE